MEPIKLIPLHVGRAEVWASGAENYSVHLTYDVSNYLKAWPDAQPSVAFERADGEKYPHAWELDGPVLHIPLLLADTEVPGMCKCMITMLSGDGRANTVVFYGSVTEGIDSLGEEPTEPMLGIIEQVNLAAADANAAKVGAEDAQDAAEEAQTNALAAAMAAQDSENAAKISEENALQAAKEATDARDAARGSAQAALNSEANALVSEGAASGHAVLAGQRASAAQQASEAAKAEAETAAQHAAAADASADAAQRHAAAAKNSATDAQEALENIALSEPMFIVRTSLRNGSSYIYESDKTQDEIREAANAGKACIAIHKNRTYVYVGEKKQTVGSSAVECPTFYSPLDYKYGTGLATNELFVRPDGFVENASYNPAKTPNPKAITFTGAVEKTYDGSANVTVNIPEDGGSGLPDHTAADTGKILYIAPDGTAAWLNVGAGLKIENGTLMLNLSSGGGGDISITENADGSVTLNGVSFVEQADGTVLLENATFTAQADGSVLIQ